MSHTEPKPTTLPNGNSLVFAYGNLFQGLPCGFRNAILPAFVRCHKGYASCKEQPGTDDLLYGKVIEIAPDTLARLDTWAEHTADYHRFLANVQIVNGPLLRGVWVFQMVEHATLITRLTSGNGGIRDEAQATPLSHAASAPTTLSPQ